MDSKVARDKVGNALRDAAKLREESAKPSRIESSFVPLERPMTSPVQQQRGLKRPRNMMDIQNHDLAPANFGRKNLSSQSLPEACGSFEASADATGLGRSTSLQLSAKSYDPYLPPNHQDGFFRSC